MGRGHHTGIDRVEAAYLRGLLARDVDLFGLARSSLGLILLDRDGLQGFWDRVSGAVPWGGVDTPGRLNLRVSKARAQAEADLRRLSISRAMRSQAAEMYRRWLPENFVYLNTGHSSLTDEGLSALRDGGAGTIAVLLHDVIPVTHPKTQRPEVAEKVGHRLKAIIDFADIVFASAEATALEIKGALAAVGPRPDVAVVPFGLDLVRPDPHLRLPPSPFFLAVGTIEPRKNYALLARTWGLLLKAMADKTPRLVIAGQMGWNDGGLKAALRSIPEAAQLIDIRADLTDGQIATLMQAAAGLLQPSRIEGFGIPVFDAATRGTPIICSDLPVYREFLKDLPIYADPDDPYQWEKHVEQLADKCMNGPIRSTAQRFRPPSWDAHLDSVLARVTRSP